MSASGADDETGAGSSDATFFVTSDAASQSGSSSSSAASGNSSANSRLLSRNEMCGRSRERKASRSTLVAHLNSNGGSGALV
jgi:hypothetical protein